MMRGGAAKGAVSHGGRFACANDDRDALTERKLSRRDDDLADDLPILDQAQTLAGLL